MEKKRMSEKETPQYLGFFFSKKWKNRLTDVRL